MLEGGSRESVQVSRPHAHAAASRLSLADLRFVFLRLLLSSSDS